MLIGATDRGEKRFIASEQGYRKAGLARYDCFETRPDDLARFTTDVSMVFKLGQKTESGWRKLGCFRRLADMPRVFAARSRTMARVESTGLVFPICPVLCREIIHLAQRTPEP